MNENEIEKMADELFEPFEEYAYHLSSIDDALSLAEAMELRFSNYAAAIMDDLRRSY